MPIVHNRGKIIGNGTQTRTVARKIIYPRAWDENGNPVRDAKGKKVVSETLMPGAHKEVTDEQLAHLKANVGAEVVNLSDSAELRDQFKESTPENPAERAPGWVPPEEVDALVEKRVKEQLAKGDGETPPPSEENLQELLGKLDTMDRGDIIALIESQELDIDPKKYKAPGSLKAAVQTGLQNKYAASVE
jgi:hypothetical protein